MSHVPEAVAVRPPVIGLTGGIACGKSTVSSWLAQKGAHIIDADAIAHRLAARGGSIYQAYLEHFGPIILAKDGELDRQAVAERVFSDLSERRWMDEMSRPLILAEVRQQLVKPLETGVPMVVLDVPLLFEAGWEKLADESWLVYVAEEEQLRRLCLRDSCTEEQGLRRIRAQMPLEEKISRADVVIDNGGSQWRTRNIVKALWKDRIHERFTRAGGKSS